MGVDFFTGIEFMQYRFRPGLICSDYLRKYGDLAVSTKIKSTIRFITGHDLSSLSNSSIEGVILESHVHLWCPWKGLLACPSHVNVKSQMEASSILCSYSVCNRMSTSDIFGRQES